MVLLKVSDMTILRYFIICGVALSHNSSALTLLRDGNQIHEINLTIKGACALYTDELTRQKFKKLLI